VARTNRNVLDALRKKLGNVSHQAIQQRRARLQKLVPMPMDIATYVIAHREGVPINRWLDESTLATVADYDARLETKEGGPAVQVRAAPATKGPGTREVKLFPGIPTARLAPKHIREAERMAEVYPLLYVFENSAREFIDGHLTQKFGKDWWDDPKLVSTDVRKTVEIARKAEAENRFHTSDKARPIYYTTFGDLVKIVESEKGRTVFKKPLFPRPTWFTELVKSSEHMRNIVAHMNPIEPADVQRLKIGLRDWLKQIAGHEPPPVE
jgi:Swt1-like HEPN